MKQNTVKKVIIGGALVVSMVGGLSVTSSYADAKQPTKQVQQILDIQKSTTPSTKGAKAEKVLDDKKVMLKYISTKDAKCKKALKAQLNYFVWSRADYKEMNMSKKDYKKCVKYLDRVEMEATKALTGKKQYKVKPLDKKLSAKMNKNLDIQLLRELCECTFDSKNESEMYVYGDYAEQVRQQRVDKNKIDEVTGGYLDLVNMVKAVKANDGAKVKLEQNRCIETLSKIGAWK